MRARISTLTMLLLGCAPSAPEPGAGIQAIPVASDVATGGIVDIVFDDHSQPYVVTASNGIMSFDGTQFVPMEPRVPDPSAALAFHIAHDGTMYAYDYRLRPGATRWERIPTPCPSPTQIRAASDGAIFALCASAVGFDHSELYRRFADGPWVQLGGPIRPTVNLYPDERAGMWLETSGEDLYVARGDTLTYVSRSVNLGFVEGDGTRVYFMTRTADVLALFTPVLAVDPMGRERMITRGSCLDRTIACPHRDDLMLGYSARGVMTPDGTIFRTWREQIGAPGLFLMVLSPGDARWHPIADLGARFPALEQLRAAPDGTPWIFVENTPAFVFEIDRVD